MIKYFNKIGNNSKKASIKFVSKKKKNKVLFDFANLVALNKEKIINQNKKDQKYAIKKGLRSNMLQRLILNNERLLQIENSIHKIAKLKDPVDRVLSRWKRPNGLRIKKVTIPIGVIGIIYESRPNVTAEVSSLCFKSGNAVILKGGSEALYSNKILVGLFKKALKKNNVDPNYVQLIENKNRRSVVYMLTKMRKFIDQIPNII